MKTFKITAHALFIVSILTFPVIKTNAQSKSHVLKMEYDGVGDNIFSTLDGKVFYSRKLKGNKDTLMALRGVRIVALDSNNQFYKETTTDSQGAFEIQFKNAKYTLRFEKAGFISLLAAYYYSIGDQFCDMDIFLAPGKNKSMEIAHLDPPFKWLSIKWGQ